MAVTLARIGGVLGTKGQFDKALEYFEQSSKIYIEYYGESHPNVAGTLMRIGGIWETKGQFDKALEYYEKDLKISIEYYGEFDPNVVLTRNSIGVINLKTGDFSSALNCFDQALIVYSELQGDKSRNTAAVKRNRARALMGLKRFDEAEQMLTEAIDSLRGGELENDLVLARTLLRFSEYLRLTANIKMAIRVIEEAISIFLINPGEQHVDTAEAYFENALIFEAMDDIQGTTKYLQKCYDIRLALLGTDHPDTIEVSIKLQKIN